MGSLGIGIGASLPQYGGALATKASLPLGAWTWWEFAGLDSAIQTVPDLSGNGRTIMRGSTTGVDANDFALNAQSASFASPQFALRDAGNDWHPAAYTVIVIHQPHKYTGSQGGLFSGTSAHTPQARRDTSNATFWPDQNDSPLSNVLTYNYGGSFEFNAYQWDYAANSGAIWIGKTKTTGTGSFTAPAASALYVGVLGSGANYTGYISEVVIWQRVLSDTEMSSAFAFFEDRLKRVGVVFNPYVNDAPATGTPILGTVTTTNAPSALTIATYDGSGQTVHPSVLDFGPGVWNGHRYWMAVTPYPAANDTLENPSIYYSDDGNAWSVPAGLTNPIEPYPGTGSHNDDPRLVLDPDGVTVYCVWAADANSGNQEVLYYRSSTDGVTWSASHAMLYAPATIMGVFLSPSVLYKDGQWWMWMSTRESSRELYLYHAKTMDGPWSRVARCQFDQFGYPLVSGWGIWHQYIIWDAARSRFVATFSITTATSGSSNGRDTKMYYGESFDGQRWSITPSPIMSPATSSWDSGSIYQSAIAPKTGGYDCWYSSGSKDVTQAWGLGRTTISVGP